MVGVAFITFTLPLALIAVVSAESGGILFPKPSKRVEIFSVAASSAAPSVCWTTEGSLSDCSPVFPALILILASLSGPGPERFRRGSLAVPRPPPPCAPEAS